MTAPGERLSSRLARYVCCTGEARTIDEQDQCDALRGYSGAPEWREKSEHRVHAIVETPKRSPHKYALSADYGIIAFSEVMPDDMEWPFDYGFVPGTLADDGDPLDILVLNDHGLFSGCLIEARLIGAVREAKAGVENDRLIAVPLPSPGAARQTDGYRDITDIPQAEFAAVTDFLRTYSQRQGHELSVKAPVGADDAMALVRKAKRAFKKARSDA